MTTTLTDLLEKKCLPTVAAFTPEQITAHLALIGGWSLTDGAIMRSFDFKNYYETLAFINAIAYVIHAEDHHPELVVTYNRCIVKFNTHSVNAGKGGISENDFICAAKVDAIFQQSFA
ncbi:4a-hydroxytetrahydrobiopterin dehydratase [Actimicrobium antarcticum]|uniref:Putative pterin-4-alpha-carbinolamine dehydratase n=1 Tax=Actimicrobium antarcticum TaxID=1051899 RepID=A0ABP7TFU1_9BURK